MSIAILGGGVEGQAVAQYFAKSGEPVHIFNNFSADDLPGFQLDDFSMVFRSPSVSPYFAASYTANNPAISNITDTSTTSSVTDKPNVSNAKDDSTTSDISTELSVAHILPPNWTSITRYFFDHCPATIIGVTGTKGKGTTCSLITSILRAITANKAPATTDAPATTPTIHLVGNIGVPALSVLDKIRDDDIVVYEMSSFQLWDLPKSPHIAVVTRIEPDHLDVHRDFDDYVNAKANITKHQTPEDYCIYYKDNANSVKIANYSAGTKLPYPPDDITNPDQTSSSTQPSASSQPPSPSAQLLSSTLDQLHIPGPHNRENATAALLACACFYHLPLDEFLEKYQTEISQGLANFKGLPHRLEFVRELNGVKYYDDNYSSAFPALDVAVKTFETNPTVLIAGGKDRGLDLTAMKTRIFSAPNLKKVILIGETKEKLSADEYPSKYHLADTLEDAVHEAQSFAEHLASSYNSCPLADQAQPVIALMSPGSASFDMFKNFSDRGDQFQHLVKNHT